MCSNCLPHREGREPEHDTVPEAGSPHARSLASYLETPISRGHLLKGLGAGIAASTATGALGWALASTQDTNLPYVVLIVLDGARRDYFDVSNIPHVRALMNGGTQYTHAFAGILESETPSGHASIGTGSEPSRTGIPSFWWGNTEGQRVSLFSPTVVRAGAMEKIIRQSGVPTLAHLVHAQAPNAKVVALSGSKYYAADAIGGPDADVTMYYYGTSKGQFVPTYIPGHPPPSGLLSKPSLSFKRSQHLPLGLENHLAMQLAVDTFERIRQRVTLINLPEFDWPLGHVDGGILDPSGVKTLMQSFDHDLAMLQEAYRKAGVLHRTLFVLMADHGMTPLRHRVSQPDFSEAVSKAGTQIVADTYTSGVYLWVKDKSKASAVAQNIARLQNQYIQAVYARVKTKTGLRYVRQSSSKVLRADARVANQYLLDTFNRANAPDVVALFTEGVGCEPGGQANWKADHGGASWQAQHIPLILSGHGIRSGYVSHYPARLIDVAPTILHAMGITPKGMQGIPLADALAKTPGSTAHLQQTMSKRLVPITTALKNQSKSELASQL